MPTLIWHVLLSSGNMGKGKSRSDFSCSREEAKKVLEERTYKMKGMRERGVPIGYILTRDGQS